MATEIRQLYDTTTDESVNIMPVTTIGAVRDSEGNSLEDILEDKANTDDLAQVATSGSYNDLNGTPTIPSISGLATESYVDTAIGNIDLSGDVPTELSNDVVTIDNDGIYTLQNISGRGNVFDGIYAWIEFVNGALSKYWIHPSRKNEGATGEPYIAIETVANSSTKLLRMTNGTYIDSGGTKGLVFGDTAATADYSTFYSTFFYVTAVVSASATATFILIDTSYYRS